VLQLLGGDMTLGGLWVPHSFRQEITCFTATLEAHFSSHTLDVCWAQLTRRLYLEALDLASLKREHEAYLAHVMCRCLLTPPTAGAHQALQAVMRTILSVCSVVHTHNPAHPFTSVRVCPRIEERGARLFAVAAPVDVWWGRWCVQLEQSRLAQLHEAYRRYVRFLCSVLTQLSRRGLASRHHHATVCRASLLGGVGDT